MMFLFFLFVGLVIVIFKLLQIFYQKVGLSAGGGDVVDLHNIIM